MADAEDSSRASIIVSLIALIVGILIGFSIVGIRYWESHTPRNTLDTEDNAHKLYEDTDGIATEDSEKHYSATKPKYLALAASLGGLVSAIVTAAFAFSESVYLLLVPSLNVATWVSGSSPQVIVFRIPHMLIQLAVGFDNADTIRIHYPSNGCKV